MKNETVFITFIICATIGIIAVIISTWNLLRAIRMHKESKDTYDAKYGIYDESTTLLGSEVADSNNKSDNHNE